MDNGSTDQTRTLATLHSDRFRVIRNEDNLGFVRACNQGAAEAKSEVIVFLNNDTVAQPHWLEWLLMALDGHQNVAAVGSRLLYPDGSIQHAGVELELDEAGLIRGVHVHAGKPGDHPEAMVPRTVPAVTGVVLAIRRQVFNRIGGFHEGYWNGNEDVDLCLTVRDAGYDIAYEPRSVLTHFESQSGHERYSGYAGNVALLNERWGARFDSIVEQRRAVSILSR